MLLIHFLSDAFKLYYCPSITTSDVLKIKGTRYVMDPNSKANQGFIGFFDWLRDANTCLSGVRLCFFGHQYHFLATRSYITPSFENKCMEISFSGDSYNPEISGDQDFTNNYFYMSDGDGYLLTIGLDHLTDSELHSLLKHCQVLNEKDLV